MIGYPAADRARRTVVAAGVMCAHLLLVCTALLSRGHGRSDDTALQQVFVTTMFDLPREQGPPPAEPAAQIRPQLQQFAPRPEDVPGPSEIQFPETVAPEMPLEQVSPPAAAAGAGQADGGVSGGAGASSGQAGSGNGLVLLQRVLPAYPLAAARRGERGITQVLLHVTPAGRVDQVKVERGSGSKLLDAAAVEAFRKWRFERLPDSAQQGRWLRTAQRFILYQFTYSRLDADAMEFVYAENLKPKGGSAEEPTAGAREALLRFMEQARTGTLDARGGASARDLSRLRKNLGTWGAAKSVDFMGLVGSGRWLRHGVRADAGGGRGVVEVSWNTFEVQHENATSEWLIAMDHNAQVWVAQASMPPE